MKKKTAVRALVACSVLMGVTIISVGAFSLSWFLGPNINTEEDSYLNGNIGLRNYFFAGDGTASDPYEIVQPIHLYNLSRLQNLGIFPEKTYFQIGHKFEIEGQEVLRCIDHYEDGNPVYTDYLDMGAFSTQTKIMTIGGEGVPFVSEFNGHGLPVKNLTVYGNPEDVGVFGYVAHQGKLENIVFDNLKVVSQGYNNNASAPDNKLFSEDIDDIFHSASYLATDTSLAFYDYDSIGHTYDAKQLKKLNGLTGTVLTDINADEHLISGTKHYNGYFKATFPNVEGDRFSYSLVSSSPLLKTVTDTTTMSGSSEGDLYIDLTPLHDSTQFNSGADSQVNSKIYLVASVQVDGYTFSRVIQSYSLEFYSNSSTYEDHEYSAAIFCDYVDQGGENDKVTGYHHGNNVGLVAGHVDGSLKHCYVYNGKIQFNETGYHPIMTETQTCLVGEIGENVSNELDPDFGLVVNGDIGVMNFSKIYSMIRSNVVAGDTVKAGQRTPVFATTPTNYISYKKYVNHESIDKYSEYLRYYDGKKEEEEFITYTSRDTYISGTEAPWHDYTITSKASDIPAEFNSVAFLWNKIIQDEPGTDRGLGVFKIATTYSTDVYDYPYGQFMANDIDKCRIVNGSPKTEVFFSTAELDHTKNGWATWADAGYSPARATTLPSYSDLTSFDYPFSRDLNYVFRLDLAQMEQSHGNNYMYNTDSDFLTNYLSTKLIDKYGNPVGHDTQRFGFMFRSSENETLSSLSSYMPVTTPGSKNAFVDENTGETRYYPSNSIVFRIENENGANVSVVGNNADITIYGYDPKESSGGVTPMYTMRSTNSAGNDYHRYFTYDVASGETSTECLPYANMNDGGALYGHIFKLPQGDYVLGARSGTANVYFLAVQGQTEGTIGAKDIVSIDDAINDVDFLLEAPTLAAFPNSLNKALFSFKGFFNTTSGLVTTDVVSVGDNKYIRVQFNNSSPFIISLMTYSRRTPHTHYINNVATDKQNYNYPEQKGQHGTK